MGKTYGGSAGGGSFELHPAGPIGAVLYQYVELGTQETEYMGEKKTPFQVVLKFLTTELIDNPESEWHGKPKSISRTFTASMGEKANLRKFIESWMGRKFSNDEEAFNFDHTKLVGAKGMLTIQHATSASGNNYAKIDSVSRLPKGMPVPDIGDMQPFFFDLADWDQGLFNKLSEYTQKLINESEEVRTGQVGPDSKEGSGAQEGVQQESDDPFEDMDGPSADDYEPGADEEGDDPFS